MSENEKPIQADRTLVLPGSTTEEMKQMAIDLYRKELTPGELAAMEQRQRGTTDGWIVVGTRVPGSLAQASLVLIVESRF